MKTLKTILSLAFALTATAAIAEGIDKTTYWNFDHFTTSNETVGQVNNPLNYGGLYIAGHGDNAPTQYRPESKKKEFTFGDIKYYTNSRIYIQGINGTPTTNMKAAEIKTDAIAFDVSGAGKIYVCASASDANRGIEIFFNGNSVKKETKGNTDVFTTEVENNAAGTYYIKGNVGGCYIYAVKFVPNTANNEKNEITMPAEGVRTFSDIHAWKVPEGMEAYVAGKNSEKEEGGDDVVLSLTKIETIPACTGVILKGTPNQKYELEAADCGSLYNGTKQVTDLNYAFRPVIIDYTLAKTEIKGTNSDYNNYLLGKEGNSLIFGPADAGTIKAGLAYYRTRGDQDLLAKAGVTAKCMQLGWTVPEVTSIDKVSFTASASINDGKCYSITGQQVDDSYKGIVIQNGKKYIRK